MIPVSVYTILLTATFGVTSIDAAQIEWTAHKTADGSHPNGNEQQMMWLMNRARSNPAAEGDWLASGADGEATAAIVAFNVDTSVLKSEFKSYPPTAPAAFEARLYEASRAQSEYLLANDTQSHDGQKEKVDASGFTYSYLGLSVFSYGKNPIYAHAAFNIDWGNNPTDGMQPGRGHRHNLMSINDSLVESNLNNVGIAVLDDPSTTNDVGPQIISIAYCTAAYGIKDGSQYGRYLVGTVWQDKNGNERYDPGEGLGGVTVRPDSGEYFAITGDAGGYAIPMTVEGNYAVTFSGGELPSTRMASCTVGTTSVLLDLNYTSDPVADALGAYTAYDGGYCVSSWLGGFYSNYWPFLYNDALGFLYTVGDGQVVFFFDFNMNGGTWLYTGPGVYPFFYDFNQNNWIYSQGRFEGLRYFTRFTVENPDGILESYP